MRIQVACPHCEKPYAVDDGSLGRKAKCSQCGRKFELSPSLSRPVPLADSAHETQLPDHQTRGDGPRRDPRSSTSKPARKTLGRFEIVELLGSGGFGKVYRAFDPQLQREVALKLPQPGLLDDPKAVERFFREARAAARLRHPHVVPVFDAGEQDGEYYIASAFIEGRTLAAAIDGKPLAPERAAAIVRKLADALDYAHRQGVLHRDVKPANIILDAGDEPHLMDFGLARFEDSEERLTRDGALVGTPAYMSPEQCDPKRNRELTAASDQYSLGCVLYELLTGRTPFSGPTPVQVHNHLKEEPASPSSANPKVPRDLVTICLKTLAKEPEKRYADCAGLAEDLHRWQQQLPIAARRIGPLERLNRWRRRNPLTAGLSAASVLLLAATAVVAMIGYAQTSAALSVAEDQRQRADDEAGRTRTALAKAEEERKRADKQARRATDEARRANAEADRAKSALLTAQSERKRAKKEATRATLAETKTKTLQSRLLTKEELDRRKFVEHCWEQGKSSEDTVTGLRWLARGLMVLSKTSLDAYPDRSRLEFAFRANLATRMNRLSRPRARLLTPGMVINALDISPDGKTIITGSTDTTARLWDAATGRPIGVPMVHKGGVFRVAFSADGKKVLTDESNLVRLWDAATGKPIRDPLVIGKIPSAKTAVFGPNGESVLAATQKSLYRWNIATGKSERVFSSRFLASNAWVEKLAISADRKKLLIGYMIRKQGGKGPSRALWHAAARIIDLANYQQLGQTIQYPGRIVWIGFSPNSKLVLGVEVLGRLQRTARFWDARTGKAQGKPLLFKERVLGFGADSKTLMISNSGMMRNTGGNSHIHFYDIDYQRASGEAITGFTGAVQSVSADGKTIVTKPLGGSLVLIWDAVPQQDPGVELLSKTLPTTKRSFLRSTAVCFNSDGKSIVTVDSENRLAKDLSVHTRHTMQKWDSTGRKIGHPYYLKIYPAFGRGLDTTDVTVVDVLPSPNGRTLLLRSKARVSVWIPTFDKAGRLLGGAPAPSSPIWRTIPSALQRKIAGLRVYPDRDRTRGGDLVEAHLFDATTGKPVGGALTHQGDVTVAVFSYDGKRILTGGLDRIARIWDVATGAPIGKPFAHLAPVGAVAFSHDGKTVLTGSGSTAQMWDAASGQRIGVVLEHAKSNTVSLVAFSADDHAIITGMQHEVIDRNKNKYQTGHTVQVWDANSGKPIGKPFNVDPGGKMTLSPDGKTVVSQSGASVRLYDIPSSMPITPTLEFGSNVDSISFSRDGKYLLIVSTDKKRKTARLWKIPEPFKGSPERISLWIELLTGQELGDESGKVGAVIDYKAATAKEARLKELGGPPR
jgi:eukaryotic-like serine/threonine-protein kinase